MEVEEMENYLIEYLGVEEEVINCVCSINGYSEDTLNDILYYYSGYQDFEQYLECEDYDTYKEYYGNEEEEEEEEI